MSETAENVTVRIVKASDPMSENMAAATTTEAKNIMIAQYKPIIQCESLGLKGADPIFHSKFGNINMCHSPDLCAGASMMSP